MSDKLFVFVIHFYTHHPDRAVISAEKSTDPTRRRTAR